MSTATFIHDISIRFLPCPFCGDSDNLSFVDILDYNAMSYSVTCNHCEVIMTNGDMWNLLKAWNLRIYTDDQVNDGI